MAQVAQRAQQVVVCADILKQVGDDNDERAPRNAFGDFLQGGGGAGALAGGFFAGKSFEHHEELAQVARRGLRAAYRMHRLVEGDEPRRIALLQHQVVQTSREVGAVLQL